MGIRLKMRDHLDSINNLRKDLTIPLCSNNVVYVAKGAEMEEIDRDILYSVLDKNPKRADAYWFISVNTMEDPDTKEYRVETYGTDYIFRVQFDLGYKVNQTINVYLRQVVRDLRKSGELPVQEKKHSIYGPSEIGSFRFYMLRKIISQSSELSSMDMYLLKMKYGITRIVGNPAKWYGLETSNVIFEYVPLFLSGKPNEERLERRQ